MVEGSDRSPRSDGKSFGFSFFSPSGLPDVSADWEIVFLFISNPFSAEAFF